MIAELIRVALAILLDRLAAAAVVKKAIHLLLTDWLAVELPSGRGDPGSSTSERLLYLVISQWVPFQAAGHEPLVATVGCLA